MLEVSADKRLQDDVDLAIVAFMRDVMSRVEGKVWFNFNDNVMHIGLLPRRDYRCTFSVSVETLCNCPKQAADATVAEMQWMLAQTPPEKKVTMDGLSTQLVQSWCGGELVAHLRVSRHDGKDGIGWDELQAVKNEVLGEDVAAVEIYPPEREVVNEANIRHLWVINAPLPSLRR